MLAKRIAKEEITQEKETTKGFVLNHEQKVLLKKLGLQEDLIGCVCDILPLRIQLGLAGAGTQTERSFKGLYGYSIYDIFETISTGPIEIEGKIRGCMTADPFKISERSRNIRANKETFTVNISDIVKTNEEVFESSNTVIYHFGFNLMMDDSAIINNPFSLTTIISRPMNIEIQVIFDPIKLEELDKKEEEAKRLEQEKKEKLVEVKKVEVSEEETK